MSMEKWLRSRLELPNQSPPKGTHLRAVICFPFSLYSGNMSPQTAEIIATGCRFTHTYRIDNLIVMGGYKGKSGRSLPEGMHMQIFAEQHKHQDTVLVAEWETQTTSDQGHYLRDTYPDLLGDGEGVLVIAQSLHLKRCLYWAQRCLPGTNKFYWRSVEVADWRNDKRLLNDPMWFALGELGAHGLARVNI